MLQSWFLLLRGFHTAVGSPGGFLCPLGMVSSDQDFWKARDSTITNGILKPVRRRMASVRIVFSIVVEESAEEGCDEKE